MSTTTSLACVIKYVAVAVFVLSACFKPARTSSQYLAGTASVDVTGPVADVNMMGYADPKQAAAGLHTRLRARAFIVVDAAMANLTSGDGRVVFVNLDYCMASQVVTLHVIARLRELYGDLYTERNVLISGIHTHSAPGGFLQYVLYQVTSLGFVRETFDSLLTGIVDAVQQAHASLQPAKLSLATGDVPDASINRSPSAYRNNPAEERSRFGRDVDTSMTVLRFDRGHDGGGGPLGCLAWFAVHCTSLNSSNRLVSGDNKGLASLLVEEAWGSATAAAGGRTTSDVTAVSNGTRARQDVARGGGARASPLSPPRGGGAVVAAFAQSNEGDVSPNTGGTFCGDTGTRCEEEHSTCGGKAEACHGRGPGWPDMFASNYIIAQRQARAALQLLEADNRTAVRGSVGFRHVYVDMSNVTVVEPFLSRGRVAAWGSPNGEGRAAKDAVGLGPQHVGRKQKGGSSIGVHAWQLQPHVTTTNGTVRRQPSGMPLKGDARRLLPGMVGGSAGDIDHTCAPAMGFSFAAGTTDGPGAFDFTQGDTKGNLFWSLVSSFLHAPSQEQKDCHAPKPILLDTGNINTPYAWQPSILPLQLLKLGQLVIVGVPAEFTTMAGRRLRDTVRAALLDAPSSTFGADTLVVIAGLANAYASYVTTAQEYQVQRYEGASTLYGPLTLAAYQQEFHKLATSLASPSTGGMPPSAPEPSPPDLLGEQLSFFPPVIVDATPLGVRFGDVVADVAADSYSPGDTVQVTFWTGCPRNGRGSIPSFLAVERMVTASGSSGASLARRALAKALPEKEEAGHSTQDALSGKDEDGALSDIDEQWQVLFDDGHWTTKFHWSRPKGLLSPESVAQISWEIPQGVAAGVYRIRHIGAAKDLWGDVLTFQGVSSTFRVTDS